MAKIKGDNWKRLSEVLFSEIKKIMINLIENTTNLNEENKNQKLESIQEFTDSILINNLSTSIGFFSDAFLSRESR